MDHESTPLTPAFLPVPDVAGKLGVIVTKVHQLLRDRQVVAVRRNGIAVIPGEFFDGAEVLRGLAGTITLLTDAGFSDDEIVDWFYAADTGGASDGTAIEALRAGRVKDVHRRAQIAGF